VARRNHHPGRGLKVPHREGQERGWLLGGEHVHANPGAGQDPCNLSCELVAAVPGITADDEASARGVRVAS
jgi:hypothetical protein